MNSTSVRAGLAKSRWLLLLALTAATVFLSGCAAVRRYSIESWQGAIPMHDQQYVQEGY